MPLMLDTLKDALAHNPVEYAALVEMDRDPTGIYEYAKRMACEAGTHEEMVLQHLRSHYPNDRFSHDSAAWASHYAQPARYPALHALLTAWHAEGVRRECQRREAA